MQAVQHGVGGLARELAVDALLEQQVAGRGLDLGHAELAVVGLDMSIIWHVSEVCAFSMALVFSSTFSHCGYDGAERGGADKCQRQGATQVAKLGQQLHYLTSKNRQEKSSEILVILVTSPHRSRVANIFVLTGFSCL